MNKKLLSLYGLKWNPFSPELPSEALRTTPALENFCWRVEQSLVREGGFALITGEPGTGKSVALRLLADATSRTSMALFGYSILYLALLFASMAIDQLIRL